MEVKRLKQIIQNYIQYFFLSAPNPAVRNFNLLATVGVAVGLSECIISLINQQWLAAILCCGTGILALFLLVFSRKTGRYRLCYYATILVIFLFGFSIIFFFGGGYLSGTPIFFVFAVVYTVFILDGKELFLMVLLELLVYTMDILAAYFFPQLVLWPQSTQGVVTDILLCTLIGAISLCLSAYLQMYSYRKQQEELEKARREAERASQAKTMFLSNISHELKSPLAVVSGYAQIASQHLRTNPAAQEEVELMHRITSEVDRMAFLVSQLLNVTRIEEDRFFLNKKSAQLDTVLKLTLDAYAPALRQNGNALIFHRLYDLPPIELDENRIRQVVVNLLANANRHTKRGTITISMEQEENFAVVAISDTGDGIAPEQIPHLFERFSPKQNRAANDTGTGLGLFICKHIIEAHGGEISITSTQHVGTCVRFTLPLKTASA